MSWLLDAYTDRRTYGTLLYLLLGLPLGIVGFVVMVTGFALGIGLLITLLGIPVLLATLVVVRGLADTERRLAWSLLGAPIPRIDFSILHASGSLWKRLRTLVGSARTWREVAFVALRLPLGIAGFTVAMVVVGLMAGGLAQPILTAAGVETQIGDWMIDTFAESLIFLPVSIVFILVGPRILLGYGTVSARMVTAVLGHIESSELKIAVARTLAHTGEADAIDITRELELMLGRGPFLTLTRVEATLIALESNGRLTATHGGNGTRYALAE
ncbi:MAG TPA: sensor domain-containing protein [Acidimicrobiia bacterium]